MRSAPRSSGAGLWTPPPPAPAQPTNAGLWRPGTRAVAPLYGRPPSRWAYLPVVVRWAVEVLGGALVLGGVWLAGHGHAAGVGRAALTGAVAVLAAAGWWCASRVRTFRHRRAVLWPLAAALHTHVGRHELENPDRWLRVPVDWAAPDARRPIRIRLHHAFTGTSGECETVEGVVRSKLGTGDLAFDWSQITGHAPHVLVRRGLHPPGRVTIDGHGVLELLEAGRESAPLAGLGHEAAPVLVDFDVDSPHMLAVGGSGGGKSVLVEALIAQGLRHGWAVSVLDRKLVSQRWLRGVPGVDYWRTIPDMHEGLTALGRELARRAVIVDTWADDDTDPDVGPRHIVLVEEANSTTRGLREWWDMTKDKGHRGRSPALRALDELAFMGRQFRMHLVTTAQSGTVGALGSAEIRENYAVRALSRYTTNAWRMLVPEVAPIPLSEHHRGRWQIVAGGIATPTQGLYLGNPERLHNTAREWALSGRRPVDEGGSPAWQAYLAGDLPALDGPLGGRLGPVRPGGDMATGGHRHLAAVPALDAPERFTLEAAAAAGIVPMGYEALKKARQRDPEFPPGQLDGPGRRYTADELVRWHRNRQRAGGESA